MTQPRSRSVPAATLLVLILAACARDHATGVPAVSVSGETPITIEVEPSSATLAPVATRQFTATAYTPSGDTVKGNMTWSSTDESVARVTQTGLVTAIGPGVALIRAGFGPWTGSADVVVEEPLVLRNVIIYTTEEFGLPEVAIVRPDGSGRRRLTTDQQVYAAPAISPDGRRIAFASRRTGSWAIYLMNADGSGVTKLVERSSFDGSPAWSPDGTRIAFRSENEGPFGPFGRIFVINVDGTGLRQVSPEISETDYKYDDGPTWSPDGSRIAFGRSGALHVINADGSGLTAFDTPELANYPDWSPDGTRIAYQGDATQDIYVRNADGSNPVRLTTDPAQEGLPRWSPDGQRLVFARVVDFAFQLFIINADGTGEVKLSATSASEGWPSWSLLP